MLLLFAGAAYRHARAALRVGADPYAAVRDVLLGNPALDLPGLTGRLAAQLLLADYAGWRRTLLILPGNAPPVPPAGSRSHDALLLLLLAYGVAAGGGYRPAADYRRRAFTAAGQFAATLQRRMREGLSQPAPAGKRGAAAFLWLLAAVWARWGYTPDKPFAAEAAAAALAGEAYMGGYANGLSRPALAEAGMAGLRYAATLDQKTSRICLAYDAVRLPPSHAWWRTHWPQNHWSCRSVVLPIFGRYTPTPESDVPWTPPPTPGFGAAPVTLSYSFGRVA